MFLMASISEIHPSPLVSLAFDDRRAAGMRLGVSLIPVSQSWQEISDLMETQRIAGSRSGMGYQTG
jgi:hypothetical protein